MLLKHYFVKKIAHSSYILAGQNTCAVIDPQRDVDLYINEARGMGVEITHILQTHLHADFVSGHMDLAKKTGAKIYVAKSAACKFDHVPLVEGDSIEIENMELKVIETPGHTPEHICYIVSDTTRSESPIGFSLVILCLLVMSEGQTCFQKLLKILQVNSITVCMINYSSYLITVKYIQHMELDLYVADQWELNI